MFSRHHRQHLAANLLQKRVIAPGCIGNDVMQRLMHLAYVAGSQTCRHRLDALALDRQHESLGVVLHGDHAISMPGSLCKTIQIGLQAFRLTGEIRLAKAHLHQRTDPTISAPGQSTRGIYFITQ